MKTHTSMNSLNCFGLSLFLLINFVSTHFLVLSYASFNPIIRPIISFCVSNIHACVVFNTNKMKCWGNVIGTGGNWASQTDLISYFNPGTSLNITKVSCHGSGTCVIFDGGRIKCTGNNMSGQAGIGSNDYYIPFDTPYIGDKLPFVNLGTEVVATDIAGGLSHNCVFTTESKVKCFGGNNSVELGYGDRNNRGTNLSHMGDNLPFIDFGVGVTVASIHTSPSASHNCVILSGPANVAQRIKCWGNDDFHQLGYGDTGWRDITDEYMGEYLPLVDLGDESKVKQLVLGGQHTCALLVNDELKCFGDGSLGQLGSGLQTYISSTGNSMPSVLIGSGKTIKLMSIGRDHTCIVYDDMITMICFGANLKGQLGQGDTKMRGNTPDTIIPHTPAIDLGTGILKIHSIYSGGEFNCVIFVDHSVKCFGANEFLNLRPTRSFNNNDGDAPGEMGANLEFTDFFLPTKAPSAAPSLAPTNSPSTPTLSPSLFPTLSPTNTPTIKPTLTPTIPKTKPEELYSKVIEITLGVIIPIILVSLVFFVRHLRKNENKNKYPRNLPIQCDVLSAQQINKNRIHLEMNDIPIATVIHE